MLVEITKEEARTVLWALEIMHSQECRRLSKKKINPEEFYTTKNLSAAFKIIRSALVKADKN